ncbi:MAG: radical SAM protein, partial [Anaerolineae bacterium]
MTVLKIHLTYQCSAACDHCRFSCTPSPGPLLDAQTAVDTARALQQTNDLDTVVILGGEPGLFPERTLGLTSSLRSAGLQVRIETNASWAASDEHAQRFLGPLFEAGASVMFSLDAFHERHVPPERV